MAAPSTIGHYRILSKLGEGGMGAVYRATDTRLNRDVAIKVLPAAFAQDAGRMARFEREAHLLASFNHPNIAAIYGIEHGALIMELVDGPDLKGPVPIETAIDYARQIALALEAAHEKGIVHRDLKPANIKIAPGGAVKLLDFGLAKASEESSSQASAASPTISPTLSLTVTEAGMILGTAAYMSPEQARGKPVDKRADIWAFGVVLFELLAGRRMFGGGETVTDTIAAVIKEEPNWNALPADTPIRVRYLLERCLRKDPKQRLRDIGEARIILDEAEPPAASPEAASKRPRAWLPWSVAALALAAAAALAGMVWLRPKPPEPVTARFPLPMPEGTAETTSLAAPQVVPSPDGRFIAFIAVSGGKSALWVRPLDSPTAHRLDNTDGAMYPFWSPDSQFLAFFAEKSLKKIPVAGGSPQTLCPVTNDNLIATNTGDGGTWNREGVIVFGSGRGKPLIRVLAAGGPPTPVTTLDKSASERWHSWPQFLPDGRHLLYFAEGTDAAGGGVYVQELGSAQRTLVLKNALRAVWSPPGYLLYPREYTLFAQPMDPRTFQLAGEPVAVAEDVTTNEPNGRAAFAVSGNGTLVYRAGGINARVGQLAWYGRDGKKLGPVGKSGEFNSMRLSPDERSVALTVGFLAHSELWMMDLATGVLARATDNSDMSPALGPWSPDLSRIAVNKSQGQGVLELTVATGKTRDLLPAGFLAYDWSPDGRFLLCNDSGGNRLVTFPAEGGAQPQTINETPYRRTGFRFAPDGRSVAYESNESGYSEVVVASFPSFAEKRQVSINGGFDPQWRKDGKELFFEASGRVVMSAEIKTAPKIEAGIPKAIFQLSVTGQAIRWAPAADGRFLVIEGDQQQTAAAQVFVVLNWTAGLKKP